MLLRLIVPDTINPKNEERWCFFDELEENRPLKKRRKDKRVEDCKESESVESGEGEEAKEGTPKKATDMKHEGKEDASLCSAKKSKDTEEKQSLSTYLPLSYIARTKNGGS
jgi:hypothetical protein